MSKMLLLAVTVLSCLLMVGVVNAQSGGGYELAPSTFGGGGVSSGGGFVVAAVVGQAAPGRMSGGSLTLIAGVVPAAVNLRSVYLPVVLRGP